MQPRMTAVLTGTTLALALNMLTTSTAIASPTPYWLGIGETSIDNAFDPKSTCRRDCNSPHRLRSETFWNNTIIGQSEANIMLDDTPATRAAARFLTQTTFGPTAQAVQELAKAIDVQGEHAALSDWLDAQMSVPTTRMTDKVSNTTDWLQTSAWWHQSITAPDQLRQRVAFALNHIMTISLSGALTKDGTLVDYYDTLADNAFGSHHQLISDVTYHIGMGVWLDNIHNNARTGQANENYARELMQLFTLGTEYLKQDGTKKLDANGKPIETYSEADVVNLAKALSGMSRAGKWFGELKVKERNHFKGGKTLFAGTPDEVALTEADARSEIDQALSEIAKHPNAGPFLVTRLIQHFVTSNPSPAYVARVVAVFNQDDNGERGNLAATIKAMLLDPDARTPFEQASNNGRVKEPVLRMTNLFRAFENNPHTSFYGQIKKTQQPLLAPTVFSWFQPDDTVSGEIEDAGLVAPELMLSNANDLAYINNTFYQLVLEKGYSKRTLRKKRYSAFNLTREAALAVSDPDALVNRYSLLLMGGQMPASMKSMIVDYLHTLPTDDDGALKRARHALYLTLSSAQQAVQK